MIGGITMRRGRLTLFAVVALAACGEETPPHTVAEFMEDPILLEATVVRCGEDRSASRYDPECINARDAVDRIAAAREQARRDELEAESERKRQALRRAREAAARARERAEEEARRREEAAYYGEFEPLPPEEGNAPPEPEQPIPDADAAAATAPDPSAAPPDTGATTPAEPAPADGPDLPGEGAGAAPDAPAPADLEAVREELQRRADESQD